MNRTLTLMTIALALFAAAPASAGDDYAVPKKFHGAWVCATGGVPTIIGANTVSFGGDRIRLTSVVDGDEERNTVIVKWSTNPHATPTEMVWKLIKLNGQQFLMDTNYSDPASATLCVKK